MEQITEKDKVHEQWYKDAKHVTIENLEDFVSDLANDYNHDYGTICHALAAAACAAAWAMNSSPTGGITGFQAGAVMWEFMKGWNGIEAPARLLQMKDMLYPQYESKFNTIGQETWDWLQETAKEELETQKGVDTVRAHWQSIVDGNVPFGYRVK